VNDFNVEMNAEE